MRSSYPPVLLDTGAARPYRDPRSFHFHSGPDELPTFRKGVGKAEIPVVSEERWRSFMDEVGLIARVLRFRGLRQSVNSNTSQTFAVKSRAP